MITNNGITLLGKYLTGQTAAFASHIAIGCGPNVLGSNQSISADATTYSYATKTSLDFEMARFPIISRTTNVIDGEQQVIFTAEIPADSRYGITEVGVYPAESNNIVGSIPSQSIFSFTTNEVWQKSLSSVVTSLDIETDIVDSEQNIDTTAKAFFLASDNAIFRSDDRLDKREQPRFFNSCVVVRGDLTALSGGNLDTSGDYIFISQPTLPDLDNSNVVTDELRFVFSLIAKNALDTTPPSLVQIKIVFTTDAAETATYSYSGTAASGNEMYIYDSELLKNVTKTSSFAWKDVTSVKIFANASNSGTSSTDDYIAFDGLRFENLASVDDRYSLAGYTKIKSADMASTDYPRPIEKPEGSTSYIEFRFALDVS
jgi:hypothetical protein